MEKETIISKLKKLKALVDRGIEGEALNAKKLLNELLIKYNIKYEEIFNEDIKKDYGFSYSTKEEKKLFFHCIANIFGTESEIWKTAYHYKNGKMKIYLKLNSFEYVLFNDFYEFHRKYWKEYVLKQQELLMSAYIQSQNIYDITPKENNTNKGKKDIDLNELMAILALSEKMKNEVPQYKKSIENV